MSATRIPRIYWLTEEFFPPEMGGTGVMAASLSQGISARNIDTTVITRQTDPPSAAEEQIGKVRVRRISPAGRLKGAGWKAFPLMLLYLARLTILLIANASRYDVVFASGMKIIPLAAVPVCRLLGKKCIVRLESPFEMVEPISSEALGAMGGVGARWMPRLLRPLQRAALRRANRVIAISQDIEDRVLASGVPRECVIRLSNAVDMSKYRPVSAEERIALRSQLQLPRDQTLVLYVGRLSRAKGVLLLIEAWPEVVARHPELRLVLVGSGEGSWDDCEHQVKEYAAAHGLSDRVIFAGRSERAHEYMQAADVFLFPSEYEGFGLSVAEALSSGLPSVISTVGAALELIEDGRSGFLFPPKNAGAMLYALERCLAERDRWSEISRRARDGIRPYDLSTLLDKYAELCRRLSD